MIRTVDFLSQADAEALLGLPMQPEIALISISTPGWPAPDLAQFSKMLQVEFDDVESPAPGKVLFDASHARVIIAFVEELHTAEAVFDLVVHCMAGMSRSPAIALFAAGMTQCLLPRREATARANQHVVEVLLAASGNIRAPADSMFHGTDSLHEGDFRNVDLA